MFSFLLGFFEHIGFSELSSSAISTKISLEDNILGQFNIDAIHERCSVVLKEYLKSKENFVLMAKTYFLLHKIPRKVLEKFYIDVVTDYYKRVRKFPFPDSEFREVAREAFDKKKSMLKFLFSTDHFAKDTYNDAAATIIGGIKLDKELDEKLIKVVQRFIGDLDASLSNFLEEDLKIKLTERKLEYNSLKLSYIEKALAEI